MTIHVNIGEAKTRFSELAARAMRGEDIVVQKAGVPMLRLVPIQGAKGIDKAERRTRIDAILAEADKIPRSDNSFELEWDENGLPI